ncbi:hypothetical protein DY000_02042752 [Brassica cretica]|uniref:Uncharacterized protein n=1 Tax=Brassica cretica TaxID=69181 RepID=A0ABQ7BNK8_BRACR|nr:hypothetical protein DY000_02042752 [Brassica cretica]
MEAYGSGIGRVVTVSNRQKPLYSLSEAGIYAACYDQTGSRLVTCEADKTIKMWKEDENATPETHPLNFRPPKEIRRF